jgi:Zn-dependent peptidase ImmA (M78 family)
VRRKVWLSQYARLLQESEKTETVEEAVAKRIRRILGWIEDRSPPSKLELIASFAGIRYPFIETDMLEGQDARLVPKDGQYFLEVNRAIKGARRRFSIAHEIAHKILAEGNLTGLKYRGRFSADIEKQEEEELCHLAARHILLLTEPYLQPILYDRDFNLDTVEHVAEKFEVSLEAAARSLIDVCQSPVAVYYCKKRVVTIIENAVHVPMELLEIFRVYKTATFPLPLSVGDILPKSSCAYIALRLNHKRSSIDTYEIDNQVYRCHVTAKALTVYPRRQAENGVLLALCLTD